MTKKKRLKKFDIKKKRQRLIKLKREREEEKEIQEKEARKTDLEKRLEKETKLYWVRAISGIVVALIGRIAFQFVGWILFIWMLAFTKFLYKEKQKLILGATVIYSLVFEVLFFIFLVTNPLLIGHYDPPVDVDYRFPFILLVASVIVIIFITGVLFARESLKAPSPELQLKGKFLLAAFISYVIGAILDAIIPLSEISVFIIPITRIILITASIEWYFGFILPERIKNIFIK
jgi:hypothetical protein